MKQSNQRKAAERQRNQQNPKNSPASAAPESTVPVTEAEAATEAMNETTPRETDTVTAEQVGSLEDVLGPQDVPVATLTDSTTGETMPISTNVDIPNEPDGGETPVEKTLLEHIADGADLGDPTTSGETPVEATPSDIPETAEARAIDVNEIDTSGDGTEVTTTAEVDPTILAAAAAESAAPEIIGMANTAPTPEVQVNVTVPEGTPAPAVVVNVEVRGTTPSAFQRLTSRNDPKATELLALARSRRLAGDLTNLTVNAASDRLRSGSQDTAIVTINRSNNRKGPLYTTKTPACADMKGIRRKGKDGYVGELTMAGRMLQQIELAGGSMSAQALHEKMAELYQNYDRGYLRGTAVATYDLWTVSEPNAAGTAAPAAAPTEAPPVTETPAPEGDEGGEEDEAAA